MEEANHKGCWAPPQRTFAQVDGLYSLGGTVLGTAPGFHHVQSVIDGIQGYGINMLFVIGGAGVFSEPACW